MLVDVIATIIVVLLDTLRMAPTPPPEPPAICRSIEAERPAECPPSDREAPPR